MLRRIYQGVSLLAIVNMLAMGGLAGFLAATGRLGPEQIQRIATVLRGESIETPAPTTQPAGEETPTQVASAQIAFDQEAHQLEAAAVQRAWREAENHRRLLEVAQLELMQREEAHARRVQQWEEEARRTSELGEARGFQKEIDLLGQISPTKAKGLLWQMSDAEVLRILDHLDVRIAKRILEEFSSPEELERLKSLMQQMGQQEAAPNDRATISPAEAAS